MNIFSIGDGQEYEITRENYMDKTHKSFPFFQDPQKYHEPYFAICPACNNPIQIINLFGEQYQEEKTGSKAMHGRHFPRNVMGLPAYNQGEYENCPIHNPVAFHLIRRRDSELINEEIRKMVDENRAKLAVDIREITGILLTNRRINVIIDDYIRSRDYCYTHTNRFNIPYSILYTSRAIDIFGQKINSSDIGHRISDAINTNSNWFKVDSERIIKQIDDYVSISLLVVNHVIKGNKQYINIKIEENYNNEINTIFAQKIEMRQFLYKRED